MSSRARQLRRQRQQVERRRAAREEAAEGTRRQQEIAAAQRDFAHQQRRNRIAYVLWVVAGLLAVSHIFEHTGTIELISQGFEDLLLGWPMAGLLAIVGGIVYGT